MKYCKKGLAILLLVSVFATTPALRANAVYSARTNSENVRVISHRGFHESAPENTMPAFYAALRHGYKYVESDVQFTKDGIAVLCHDSTINRTARRSDGSYIPSLKYIKDLTFKELLEYDFGIVAGAEYKGTKIPTLKEWLTFCKQNRLTPYVEIKQQMNWAQIGSLLSIANSTGITDNLVWIAFTNYSANLKQIKNLDRTAEIGVLAYGIDTISMNIAHSLQTGFNRVFLDINYIAINKLSMSQAKQQGLEVEAWTVNDIKTSNALVNIGVRGITTNTIYPTDITDRISSFEAVININYNSGCIHTAGVFLALCSICLF